MSARRRNSEAQAMLDELAEKDRQEEAKLATVRAVTQKTALLARAGFAQLLLDYENADDANLLRRLEPYLSDPNVQSHIIHTPKGTLVSARYEVFEALGAGDRVKKPLKKG